MGIFYELMVGFGFGWAQLAGFSGVGQVFAELSHAGLFSLCSPLRPCMSLQGPRFLQQLAELTTYWS